MTIADASQGGLQWRAVPGYVAAQLTGAAVAVWIAHGMFDELAAYIASAYGFTASTSFANSAVTVGRALTDTFAGIRPGDVPGFLIAQLAGAATATVLFRWLVPSLPQSADAVVVRRPLASAS